MPAHIKIGDLSWCHRPLLHGGPEGDHDWHVWAWIFRVMEFPCGCASLREAIQRAEWLRTHGFPNARAMAGSCDQQYDWTEDWE